jgi:copper chaperone CopZ
MQKGLGKLPGVAKVDVSLETGVASVQFNPGSGATLAQVRDLVLRGGFTADKTLLTVQGVVSQAGGRVLLDDGTAEQYQLTGLSAAQTAALKPGAKVEVQGQVQSVAPGTPVVLAVNDVKAL